MINDVSIPNGSDALAVGPLEPFFLRNGSAIIDGLYHTISLGLSLI